MKIITKPIIGLFVFISTIILVGVMIYSSLGKPVDPKNTKTLSFSIDRGETIDSISFRLKERGLVRSQAIFKITVSRLGLAKNIQAGQFQLSPSWNVDQLAQSLTLGRDDLAITLLEGLRREEFADELSKQLSEKGVVFDQQTFLLATKGEEGFLFPDTYFLPKIITTKEIVKILTETFEEKVDKQLLSKIQAQGLSIDQAITIASLVEREARLDEERPYVAGIIIKRLRNDWKLQIDATVQYALGYQSKSNSWWKQDLTFADLEIDSPFNTYIYYGLPPAPICNPSLSSIKSVANQIPSKYWYYISDRNGNMHYAETIIEHNQNISMYLGK